MFYFQKRYVRTESGRIFKLDGWNPLLELKEGTWIRPRDYQDEVFMNGKEISQEEANKNAFSSDEGIESDNAAPFYQLSETVFASATLRYDLLMKSMKNFLSKKEGLGQFATSDFRIDSTVEFYTWLDCITSAFSYFAALKVFHNDRKDYNEKVVQPFFHTTALGLIRMLWPKAKFEDNDLINELDNSLQEFNRAEQDKDRIEQLFMTVFDKKDAANINIYDRSLYCLCNRFYFRSSGFSEEKLVYDPNGPLFITSVIARSFFLMDFKNVIDCIADLDQKAIQCVKNGEI